MIVNAAGELFCEMNASHTRRFSFGHPGDRGTDGRGDTTGPATDSAFHPAKINYFANKNDFRQICICPGSIENAVYKRMRKITIILLATLVVVSCLKQEDYHIDITFTGEQLRQISCPLGGIGTGNMLLNGYGAIRNIEIFNAPSMDVSPTYMPFFSLFAKATGQEPVVRVLEREFLDEYSSPIGKQGQQMGGLPRFREAVFHSAYPVVHLDLIDEEVPLQVTMTAWSPFIPSDAANSSLPAAVIEWNLSNPGREAVAYSIAFSMGNPIPGHTEAGQGQGPGGRLTPYAMGRWNGFTFSSHVADTGKPGAGDFRVLGPEGAIVVTTPPDGGWSGDAQLFRDDFSDDGQLEAYADSTCLQGTGAGSATLYLSGKLEPGETATLPVLFAWHVPYRQIDEKMAPGSDTVQGTISRNYYSVLYKDINQVTEYLAEKLAMLKDKTHSFSEAMITSSVPPALLDAAISNLASLQSNLLVLDEKRNVNGCEGLGHDRGIGPGNGKHIQHFAQPMAALFPSLEGKICSRYEGSGGNPFAETGSESENARTYSGWAEYQEMAGYAFDATKQRMKFSPVEDVLPVRFFWTAGSGWGTLEVSRAKIQLTCIHGTLDLDELVLEGRSFFVFREFLPSHDAHVSYDNMSLIIAFDGTLSLNEGEAFRMDLP